MPTKKKPRPRRRPQATAPVARSRRPSLLILHLDADRLRTDRLHLGEQAAVAAMFSAYGLGADVAVVEGTDRADLHRVLSELTQAGRTFDVVAVIAHSNSRGIKIAADVDAFVDWRAFAAYLKPLKPRRLVLVACQAGQWPAAKTIFGELSVLRRIYASPVNASKDLGALMLWLLPHVVGVKVPKKKHVQWAQVVAVALTGRQLRMWQRTDKDDTEGMLLDVVARALDSPARRIPRLLQQLLR